MQWSRTSGMTKPLALHLIGVGLACDRLAYIVAIRFFEPSLYFLELLWHAIWSFGGAYVLTAAETWIVLSFGNEHSKAIHLKLLSSAESFRRMHALLHLTNPLMIMPLFLYAVSLQNSGHFDDAVLVRRMVFFTVPPFAVFLSGTLLAWTGWSLYQSLTSVEGTNTQQSVSEALKLRARRRSRMVFAVTLTLAGACYETGAVSLILASLYRHINESKAAPVVIALFNTGVIPGLFLIVRTVMPPPTHASVFAKGPPSINPETVTPEQARRAMLKYRVSRFFAAFPAMFPTVNDLASTPAAPRATTQAVSLGPGAVSMA
eukprot:TRINITY_DN14537_c0_g1_i6.p1 TRINITY_DN14537_c0_g1~~TRINITY_DN14537_c0_g1_i6.p1  ORF type:complete len:363 (+),score=59.94 TRINITY_DN14537_c0_g1_i6:136-1089(+)